MEATKTSREELLELVRQLRGWADTYEDWMGGEDFKRRAETLAQADAVLLAETGRI